MAFFFDQAKIFLNLITTDNAYVPILLDNILKNTELSILSIQKMCFIYFYPQQLGIQKLFLNRVYFLFLSF